MTAIKWYTEVSYVDVDTGEILTKSAFERGNYIKINKEIVNTVDQFIGVKKILYHVRKSRQQRLFS